MAATALHALVWCCAKCGHALAVSKARNEVLCVNAACDRRGTLMGPPFRPYGWAVEPEAIPSQPGRGRQ